MISEITKDPIVLLFFLLVMAWSLVWKGLALWRSAQRNEPRWFIFMLIINTFGILELLYIFVFSKEQKAGDNI